VLIDGRFRVACFLTSILHAEPPCRILFDDYRKKERYHVVERILSPVDFCGRQALFEVPPRDQLDTGLASTLLDRFAYVMD